MTDKEVKETKKATPKKKTTAKKDNGVYVDVAGKKRKVRFPVSSFIKMKNETGIVMADLEDPEKAQDIETIIAVIWAGLVSDDPKLTIDFLADNMEMHELGPVTEKVMGVITAEGKKG